MHDGHSAIEPLFWTPLLFLRCRALFNDPLAASLEASHLPIDIGTQWLEVEVDEPPSVIPLPDDPPTSTSGEAELHRLYLGYCRLRERVTGK